MVRAVGPYQAAGVAETRGGSSSRGAKHRSRTLFPCSKTTQPLKTESCSQLNLTAGADGRKYPADVIGELPCCILENGVSVPSEGKRTLRVARDRKIRMIEHIVGFRSDCNFAAFCYLEVFVQCEVKLS